MTRSTRTSTLSSTRASKSAQRQRHPASSSKQSAVSSSSDKEGSRRAGRGRETSGGANGTPNQLQTEDEDEEEDEDEGEAAEEQVHSVVVGEATGGPVHSQTTGGIRETIKRKSGSHPPSSHKKKKKVPKEDNSSVEKSANGLDASSHVTYFDKVERASSRKMKDKSMKRKSKSNHKDVHRKHKVRHKNVASVTDSSDSDIDLTGSSQPSPLISPPTTTHHANQEDQEVYIVDSDSDLEDEVPSQVGRSSTTDMEERLQGMRREFEELMRQKDEEIVRLRNEVSFKNQQLEDLSDLATKNMELEARVSAILNNPSTYQAEVTARAARKAKKKKSIQQEKVIEDSDIEEITEEESNAKVKTKAALKEKPKCIKKMQSAVEVIVDDDSSLDRSSGVQEQTPAREAMDTQVEDGDLKDSQVKAEELKSEQSKEDSPRPEKKQRRRSQRKKSPADEPEEKIEALFVTDDEDDEESSSQRKRRKEKGKKKERKNESEKEDSGNEDKDSTKEKQDDDSPDKGRHNIRRLMADKKLTTETKAAALEEKERIERVAKLKEKHQIVSHVDTRSKQPVYTKMVLAFKKDEKTPLIEVNSKVLRKLKPHQVEGVEFLWDCVIEKVELARRREPGSGCLLAHCMGLGKTLSVIAFVHTVLTHRQLKLKSCLVVCPLNTVLNWQHEWSKWLDKKDRLPTYEMATAKNNHTRAALLSKWQKDGGIMILGYQIFRILATSTTKSKKKKKIFEDSLINPGPDIIVCDEGHVLKNDASAISKCMNRVRTKRRIVLTGTPLQNNLVEYHCMVSFVKPNLLGTRREFSNRFVNPITNGQHADSTLHDVKLMKRRAHVLHKMLSGCVQRRDYSALTKFLPPKYEYVVSVRLSPLQIELYEKFLAQNGRVAFSRGTSLFADYQALMRIWTHPWVLKMDEIRQEKKATYCEDDDDELGSFLVTDSSEEEDDEEEDAGEDTDQQSGSSVAVVEEESQNLNDTKEEAQTSQRTRRRGDNKSPASATREVVKDSDSDVEVVACEEAPPRRAKLVAGEVIKHWQTTSRRKGEDEENPEIKRPEEQWWADMVQQEHKEKLELSGKLVLLFDILRMAEGLGDKVLVFSQSLLSLDLIEDFLHYKNEEAEKLRATKKGKSAQGIPLWKKDEDFCRMDGSTSAQTRTRITGNFNSLKNKRMRLFLISTKAGGLGINLDSANRVVIFDASWNPSHDIQSIFRAYRFGQEKNVFIYRLLAQGTMEEKIYERQVTKETLSQRVIDEHQLDRHFTASDLKELYKFEPDRLDDPDRPQRPTPKVPKDIILAELLSSRKDWIVGYHEHDSLLEKRPDEDLSEEECQAAWDEYEREKQGFMAQYRTPPPVTMYNYTYRPQQLTPTGPPLLPMQSMPAMPPSMPVTSSPMMPLVAPPTGFSSEQAKLNFQLSQLPRVVQEILKYNPNITPMELQSRLRAFMGMHTKYSNVPGFALKVRVMGVGQVDDLMDVVQGNSGPRNMSPAADPGLIGQPGLAMPPVVGTSAGSMAGLPLAMTAPPQGTAAAGLVPGAADSSLSTSTLSGIPGLVSPAQLAQVITSSLNTATTQGMPSRLPLPGRVPANEQQEP